MKKVFMVTAAILVGIISCTKSTIDSSNSFSGKWLWIKSAGGITGNNVIFPQVGESSFLEFFQDSTYTLTKTGTAPTSYTNRYSIISVMDISTNEQKPAVILYDETLRPQLPLIIEGGDNQLKLKENCADCYTHYYSAVK